MAQNTAVAEEKDTFKYPIRIEDGGPATKRVTVEIPADRIAAKITEQYKELRANAVIPGFRPGKAPQSLIEKRFAADVKEQVRQQLIRESYEQAVEDNSLDVVGEPAFDNPAAIQLPDAGPMTYSFQIEVQPEIALPPLDNVALKKPKLTINDDNLAKAMQNLREQQGTLVPVTDRGIKANDFVVADIHLKLEGIVVGHIHDAQIASKPGRIGGVFVEDLDKKLEGLKIGEKRDIEVDVPADHAEENLRGRKVVIEFAVKDIKFLELAEINAAFLESLGFENEAQLKEALTEEMQKRVEFEIQSSLRGQVNKYLVDNVTVELPAQLSAKQAQRVMQRRALELRRRGVSDDQIRAHIEQIATGADTEAAQELKLFFILQKLASDQKLDVDESELNGQIATMAAQQGRRPEKLKQEMMKDGSLMNLFVMLREQKAVDAIIAKAAVTEVDPSELAPKPA